MEKYQTVIGGDIGMETNKNIRAWVAAALFTYAICLIWVISFKCNIVQPVVESRYFMGKMSFFERVLYSASRFVKTTDEEFFVNILLFIPLGLATPFFFKKRIYICTVLSGLAISLAFEISQIIDCIGGFTYIDIYCNTLGAMLGAILHFYLINKIRDTHIKAALIVCTVGGALLSAYGILNTIKTFDIYVTPNLGKYL